MVPISWMMVFPRDHVDDITRFESFLNFSQLFTEDSGPDREY